VVLLEECAAALDDVVGLFGALATLPAKLSKDIRAKHGPAATSIGSINVLVTVGATHLATSLFPARSHRCYVLPIQKSVQVAERLVAGSPVEGRLDLR
jgi:hypothetical protein